MTPGLNQQGRRPGFRRPQLATLVSEAPEGDDWLHETKFDGYRCLAALGRGGPVFYSRSGKDWTEDFAPLRDGFSEIDCSSALIDGEVMARNIRGSAFSSLQTALKKGGALVFFAFDLLSLDGVDLTGAPLIDRRARLDSLLSGKAGNAVRLSDCVRGRGPQVYRRACEAGAEGIISKRADAAYSGARGRAWLKVKCTRWQEFVIGGWTPSDKRGRPFSSLLLGDQGATGLRYRGRVGSGFKDSDFEALTRRMQRRKTSPFVDVPRDAARNARWVTPNLVAEVDFAEFTADGRIRHGTFLGLREDKSPEEVKVERPVQDDEAKVAGVRISSAGRKVFAGSDCTKRDLARFYEKTGPRMIPLIGHRPLVLLRCPEGATGNCFFQKHPGPGFAETLHRVGLKESGSEADYFYATRPEALVAAVQMGTVEFHTWGARIDRPDRPDRLVFDLDPDEGLAWERVRDAAFEIRDRLAVLGLESGAIVTGGKGVHVWLPLRRTQPWETVRIFARTFAHVVAELAPERYTATMSRARRKGRIFIDWMRNERGSSAVSPYSARARKGATVAVPVTWKGLERLDAPDAFTVAKADEWMPADCPAAELRQRLQTLGQGTAEKLDEMMRRG